MFDQINGLPVHALVLHAAVIFVPLLALGTIVYAVVPRLRAKIDWAVGLLAIVAPLSALAAKLSGEKLYDRLIGQGMKGDPVKLLDTHMGYGTKTFWFALALGVVALVALALGRRGALPRPAEWAASAVLVVLAVVTTFYCYKTGDSGATAVWKV